ncbi:PREDICTED: uncharacterized protein LOC109225320 isoform X2 [Nicotiana attenuata]|uniref:uncharacterized protein LOC109225320 isoform X2 n=1 Tax=Nicotiana attenuata TaxID=49451 RepID=UPI000905825A|nr:PREDICTED: uncharacterized protein LOC109225320 isoform X2 [Nicotiana attenuata]
MNQEGCSSKNKKISNRIPAGSLASLRNQKVSSLTTKRTSQAIRFNENEERQSESRSLAFLRNQSLTTKRTFHENEERQSEAEKVSQRSQMQEKVRQVPLISTSSTAQGVQEQVRQVPMNSITPTSQAVHEPSEDSTNHEAIEQSEEPGPSAPKRKRGPTQMQSVHGRKDRKIIVLNEFNQPIGPTNEVVKELGSFLGTLGRNETFCPLNVFDWRKVDKKNDIWKMSRKNMTFLKRRRIGFLIQFVLLGESIKVS